MIIFLDVNNQLINIYGEDGRIEIPFKNAGELMKYAKNDNFLYVTNAIETSSQKVIDLIGQMGISVEEPKKEKLTYIHVANEGVIPIDEELRFRGKYDTHPLTEEFVKKIKETQLLQDLIKNGKLEMITSSRRKELEEERLKKENERYGAILVEEKVDDFINKKGKDAGGEAIVIDLDDRGSVSEAGEIGTMEELMSEMEGLE